MRTYIVVIPYPGGKEFRITAESGFQAKLEAARMMRHRYPRKSLTAIADSGSAFLVDPHHRAGRHKTYY